VAPKDITLVVFSGQMMGCVALDRQMHPLSNTIIWDDQKTVDEAKFLLERVGREPIYSITGHHAGASYSGPKIMWIRNHQTELFTHTYKFVQAKDFIVARLTVNFVTDYSDASGTNLYDLKSRDWSELNLETIGLDRERLPELHQSTDVVGEATAQVADEVGLAVGTPGVIGGGDGPCVTVGAGVVREDSAYNNIGSSSWIGIATRDPIIDPTQRTFTFAFDNYFLNIACLVL
jgi:xylulokinase